MLTNYNGTNISYDEIGNPLNWHNVTSMTWTQGRRLTAYTYTENGKTYNVSLAYNSEGIRIQKIAVNANDSSDMKIHVYTVDGSVIIREYVYTLSQGIGSSSTLYYIYDASGDCIGFKEGNRETYLFGKNAQGDVVALFNSATEVVARYYYDAWGNCISVKDANGNEITNKNNIAHINPIRYRSYYYDTDTGFYYLNSRYYDPQVGRFINADVLLDERSVLGYNLFAYCWNNPVCFKDVFGQFCVNIVILPPNVVTSASPIDPSKTVSFADWIIIENAEIIKSISSEYNVDPLAVAGAIYAEQSLNVDLFDSLTDWLSRYGFNTSVGIGQVRLKTAEMLEKEGYVSATERKILFKLFEIIPVYESISVTRSKRLNDNTQNITYVAAYIRYMIDVWQNECPDISSRIDILTTLYNNGKTAAHSNPKSSPFGDFVQSNLGHISGLLYG